MNTVPNSNLLPISCTYMSYEARISAAIAELGKQDVLNFAATARKHNINRITLARRFRGESEARDHAHLNCQGRLTATQEQHVIAWIGQLSARKLPPTPGMIKRYVERLIGEEISDHWVPRFYERNKNRLKGKYLPGLDANRVYATASQECFQIWFENVRSAF